MTVSVRAAAIAAAVTVSFWLGPVQPGFGAGLYTDAMVIASDVDERRKSNMAARQGMLVHRMVEAACFALLDVEADAHWDQLAEAQALFRATAAALKDGNPVLHLKKEEKPRIRQALADVGRAFKGFDAKVTALLETRAPLAGDIKELADGVRLVASTSDRVARLIDRAYVQKVYPMRTLVALNIAGRERITAQQITKNYCLVAADIDAQVHRLELEDEIELFESRLTALRDGEPLVGLSPAPTEEIREAVDAAIAYWEEMMPAMDAVRSKGELSEAQVTLVADHATPLIGRINQIVYLFEAIE